MRHALPSVVLPRTGRGLVAVFLMASCLVGGAAPLLAGGGKDTQQVAAPTPRDPNKRAQIAREQAQLRMLLGDMTRPIGPSDEALAPVKEKLSKAIKIQFLDTPFERVIEFLQRESGVTILIDRNATNGREDSAVALEAEKMTLKEALDWACLVTDTDWDVIKGVVVVSTSGAIQRRQIVTKVYDIRGFVIQVPDFIGAPEFDLNSALSNTSSGGSSGGAQSATTLFSESDRTGEQPTRAESIEQLVTLIQDTVGKQSEWAAYGGEVSSLREMTGNLIIKTTPRNHKDIEELLAKMAASQEKMISVDARYYVIKSKVLDELIKKNDGEFIIGADKLEEFMKGATDPAAGSKRLGAAKLVMFNGQRTFLTAANAMSFLSDIEPVSGGEGVDPTTSVLLSGARVDVEATVTQNGKSIIMTFRGEVITGKELRQAAIPATGGSTEGEVRQSGKVTGTVTPPANPKDAKPAPAAIDGTVTTKGEIVPAKKTAASTAPLDLPEQDGVGYRTSVAIPNGGAVLLTGASSMMRSVSMEDSEVVLIVRAKSK
jgi:hypothetical protein